ncbi:hypothetical protein Tco_0373527 [Tanacetum coccineum]
MITSRGRGIAKVANAPCEEVGLRKVMVLAGGTVNEVNMTGRRNRVFGRKVWFRYVYLGTYQVVAPVPAVSTGSPSSTTVDQDAPLPSSSQKIHETQSPILPNDFEEDNHDLDVSHMNNDPFIGITIPENDSEASSSDVIPTVVQTAAPNSEHVTK